MTDEMEASPDIWNNMLKNGLPRELMLKMLPHVRTLLTVLKLMDDHFYAATLSFFIHFFAIVSLSALNICIQHNLRYCGPRYWNQVLKKLAKVDFFHGAF